jgi:hypothetical protein
LADHVVINTMSDPPGRFECENCGSVYTPAMPVPITMYTDMIQSFVKAHKDCELLPEGERRGPAKSRAEKEGGS